MWLHNYLHFRSEASDHRAVSAEHSVQFLVKWYTFGGLRTKILSSSSEFLKSIQNSYMKKFQSLPENILTRAMMVIGLIIGPIAPLPLLIVDLTVLLSLAVVFTAGWIVGGTASIVLAGLGWIIGGSNTSSAIFAAGTEITENIMYLVLGVLSVPAGAASLVGLVPSLVLETITENLNYICISSAHTVYNLDRSGCRPTTTTSSIPQNHNAETQAPTVTETIAQTEQKPIVWSFQTDKHAAGGIAGEVLVEVAKDSLPSNKLEIG